jgi:O-antigen/teichoic acid export membrane protein
MRRGAVWSIAATIVGALGALLVTPELIRTLGAADFGLYVLILAVTSYTAFLDFGLPWAATRYFAEDLAHGRVQVLASRLQSTAVFLLAASIAGGVTALAVVPWLARLSGTWRPDLRPVVMLGAVSVGLAFQASLLQALLRAAQRFDQVGRIALVTSVLLPLGSYVAVRWQPGVTPLVAVNLMVNLVALVLLAFAAARQVPDALRTARWEGGRLREMVAFSGWSSVARLVTVLMLQMDRLLVALLGSATALTYYAVPAQLAARMNLFGGVSTQVFFSRTSWLRAGDRLDDLRRQHATMRRLLVWAALGLTLPVVTLGPAFLEAWIDRDMRMAGGPILVLLAIGHGIISVTSIDAAVLEGSGRPDLTAKVTAAWAVIALAAGILLLPWLQATAIAGALALWLVGIGVTTAVLARWIIPGDRCGSRDHWFVLRLAGALAVALGIKAAVTPLHAELGAVLVGMALSASAVLMYGLLAILHPEDRRRLLARRVTQA